MFSSKGRTVFVYLFSYSAPYIIFNEDNRFNWYKMVDTMQSLGMAIIYSMGLLMEAAHSAVL